MMVKAIYAFSGDPITFGHIDIIKRAAKSFDKLVVGIGVNPKKKYMFNLEERTEMARKSLKSSSNVEVVSFKGLLVDYAYENGISVIVKGVRNSVDFNYENLLHQVGESQQLGIDTHILFAKPELSHISSSSVKDIQEEHGLIHEFVPLYVKQILEAKMSGQYILGITGEIGSGKSFVSQKFIELGAKKGIPVHHIELDYLGHKILSELKEQKYKEVREKIASTFGPKLKLKNGTIDRKALGEIVFNNPDSLKKLNEIMYTPLLVRLRKELFGKKGLILFNAALIAESNMSYLSNNNVLLVHVDKVTQKKRLAQRKLTSVQIARRLKSQYNYSEKKEKLQQSIKKDNNGKIWLIDNSEIASKKINSELEFEKVFDKIINVLNVKYV